MNLMRISIQQDQLPSVGEIHSKFMLILYMKGRLNEPEMSTNFETPVPEIVILSTASETGRVNPRRLPNQDASCTTAE